MISPRVYTRRLTDLSVEYGSVVESDVGSLAGDLQNALERTLVDHPTALCRYGRDAELVGGDQQLQRVSRVHRYLCTSHKRRAAVMVATERTAAAMIDHHAFSVENVVIRVLGLSLKDP